MNQRVGVFVDIQNLYYSAIRHYDSKVDFNQILKEIQNNYVEELPADSLIEGAIDGMLEVLGDPHTDYLSKQEYEALMISTKGEFGGIGATIGERNDVITVISPLEGTPAYRAGLLPGDGIVKVDGVPTKGKTVDVVVREIRGKPGTKVILTISRTLIDEHFDVEIIRAIIRLDAVPYYGMVSDGIGYVQLRNFSRTADSELKNAIDSLFAQGARKLIFDLRLNSGGLLNDQGESIDYDKDGTVLIDKNTCTKCYACIEKCDEGALTTNWKQAEIIVRSMNKIAKNITTTIIS